jgi:glutathione S-transferase
MEGHLKDREFFVGDSYSIADVALYAYTHVAHEGASTLAASPPSTPGWSGSRRSQGTYL